MLKVRKKMQVLLGYKSNTKNTCTHTLFGFIENAVLKLNLQKVLFRPTFFY